MILLEEIGVISGVVDACDGVSDHIWSIFRKNANAALIGFLREKNLAAQGVRENPVIHRIFGRWKGFETKTALHGTVEYTCPRRKRVQKFTSPSCYLHDRECLFCRHPRMEAGGHMWFFMLAYAIL